MDASTSTPIANAMPPRDMMFEVTPSQYMGMNDTTTAIGKARIAMSADRKWNRKTMITRLTMTASSRRSRCRVLMDASIRSERSYPGMI